MSEYVWSDGRVRGRDRVAAHYYIEFVETVEKVERKLRDRFVVFDDSRRYRVARGGAGLTGVGCRG